MDLRRVALATAAGAVASALIGCARDDASPILADVVLAPTAMIDSAPNPICADPGDKRFAFADFDGANGLDAAVINASSGSLTLHLNNGNGAFTSATVHAPTGMTPVAVAAGDFDGVNRPDIAVAWVSTASGAAELRFYLNSGTGQFPAAGQKSVALPARPACMTAANFDRNPPPARDDVALAIGDDPATATDESRVLFAYLDASGAAALGPAFYIGDASMPHAIASGDLDKDKDVEPDIIIAGDAVVSGSPTGHVTILTNNAGAGFGFTLHAKVSIGANLRPVAVVVSDLLRPSSAADDALEVAVLAAPAGLIYVVPNLGGQAPAWAGMGAAQLVYASGLDPVDFDAATVWNAGSPSPDFALLSAKAGGKREFRILENRSNPGPLFVLIETAPAPDLAAQLRLVDLDNNTVRDLATPGAFHKCKP